MVKHNQYDRFKCHCVSQPHPLSLYVFPVHLFRVDLVYVYMIHEIVLPENPFLFVLVSHASYSVSFFFKESVCSPCLEFDWEVWA